MRSYSCYTRDLKHIFHLKNLHLGHVAKSFGLRQSPNAIVSDELNSANTSTASTTNNNSNRNGNGNGNNFRKSKELTKLVSTYNSNKEKPAKLINSDVDDYDDDDLDVNQLDDDNEDESKSEIINKFAPKRRIDQR